MSSTHVKPLMAAALLLTCIDAAAIGFMPWHETLAKADLDGDRKVTASEVISFHAAADSPGFQPYMVTHFADYDADNDGAVTQAEIKTYLAAHKIDHDTVSRAFHAPDAGFAPWGDQ